MGNQPFDSSQPGGVPPQPGQFPGSSDPGAGWAPPGWGSQGAPGATPPGWGSPGAPGAMPPGWGAPPPSPPSPWGGPGSSGWSGQYPPPGVPSGNRAGKVIAVFLGVILIAAAVGIPVFLLTKQSPAAQASALLKQAMQAGEKSAGFQYVDTWTGGGSTATFSGEAGQNDGTQQITQTTGFGNEQFQVVLAPDQTLYFKGNVAALEDQLGVSSSAAAGLTGTWISSQSSDGPYQDLALGLPISSALPDGQLTPTSTEQVTGAGGVSLTRIEGTVANPTGTGHLDVSASSNLPVTFVASYSNGSYGETMTFSAWGTAPSLTVPTSAVAWSTLTTSKPPDGYGSGETPTAAPSATPSPSGVGSAA
jgi:hypothetical protein